MLEVAEMENRVLDPYQPLWKRKDVCRYTNLSDAYIKALTGKGLIPSVPFGRARRYVPAQIAAWAKAKQKVC
jgi:hypothetical protein